MPERWFITGTGTAIGKTLVTAALACQFRAQGRSVTALKPVLSGFEREAAAGSDSGILLAACGLQLSDASLDAITPWRFREPLSPDMAAAREGRALELGAIVDFCRAAAEDEPDVCLVEGVGGSMVPLDAEYTVLDWIVALRWPSLLVAGSYLGTLSHTLTTFEAMVARGAAPAAILLCESEASPVPIEETCETLERFLPKDVRIGSVPRVGASTQNWRELAPITELLTRGAA